MAEIKKPLAGGKPARGKLKKKVEPDANRLPALSDLDKGKITYYPGGIHISQRTGDDAKRKYLTPAKLFKKLAKKPKQFDVSGLSDVDIKAIKVKSPYFVRGYVTGRRNDDNLSDYCSLLILDWDNQIPPAEKLQEVLSGLSYAHVQSWTPGRRRTIIETEPYHKDDSEAVHAWFVDYLHQHGISETPATEGKVRSQAWFCGWISYQGTKRKYQPIISNGKRLIPPSNPVDTSLSISTGGADPKLLDRIRSLSAPGERTDRKIALYSGDYKIVKTANKADAKNNIFPSQSEADFSLYNFLISLVGKKPKKVKKLFKGSALYREKHERKGFLEKEIKNAIDTYKDLDISFDVDNRENLSEDIRQVVELRLDLGQTTTPDDICRELLGGLVNAHGVGKIKASIRLMKNRNKLHNIGSNLVLDTGIKDVAMTDFFSAEAELKMHKVLMPGNLQKFVPLNVGGTMAVIGETNAGKTTFAIELFVINVMAGNTVHYFSTESTKQEVLSTVSTMVHKKDRKKFQELYQETESKIKINPVLSEEMFDPNVICIFDYLSVEKGNFHEIYARVKKAAEMFTPNKGCLFLFGQRDAGKKNPVGGNKFFQPVRAAIDIGKLYYADYRILTARKSKFPGSDGKDYEGKSCPIIFDKERRLVIKDDFDFKNVSEWKEKLSTGGTIKKKAQRLFTYMVLNNVENIPVQKAKELLRGWTKNNEEKVKEACSCFDKKMVDGTMCYIRDSYIDKSEPQGEAF